MQTKIHFKAAPSTTHSTLAKAYHPAMAAPSMHENEAPLLDTKQQSANCLGHSFDAISVLPPAQPIQSERATGIIHRFLDFNSSAHRKVNSNPTLQASWTLHPPIQTKLTVGAPNDVYEQEADRVADQVMRMAEPKAVTSNSAAMLSPLRIQRVCAECEKDLQRQAAPNEQEDQLQPKAQAGQTQTITQDLATRLQASRGNGQPLAAETRAFMEPRFGHDFSQVRIHTGGEAVQMNRALNAQAFTHNQDVFFGAGRYDPQSGEGKRLLAHELTHVVQQRTAASPKLIQRELVYGSAYPRPYHADPAETRSAEADTWYPASIDFRATATGSGGGDPIASFDELLGWIGKKSAGSITQLGLIGHANDSNFGLSGTITTNPKNVTFTPPGLINSQTLSNKMNKITAVRDRFAANAKLILYGCHAGAGQGLLEDISTAFGICVKGFTSEVLWCITWNTPARHITSRGRVFIENANDPLAGAIRTPCTSFHTSVSSLTPDSESCKGVAKPKATTSETMMETEGLQEGNRFSEDVTAEV